MKPDGRLVIEVLEMRQGEKLPARFRATLLDRQVTFEMVDGGYRWSDESDPSYGGFQALPDLRDVATWSIDRDEEGGFQAELPLSHFKKTTGLGDAAKGPFTEEEPKVSAFGFFDSQTRGFEVSVWEPSAGGLLDVSVSFAAVPDDVFFAGFEDGTSEKLLPIAPIVITFADILVLLGLTVISCALAWLYSQSICDQQCTFGVESSEVSCISGTLTCHCMNPPLPPCLSAQVTGVRLMSLDDQAPELDLPDSAFALSRTEDLGVTHHGTPIRFLMGEWALVTYSAGSGPEVLQASSDAFGRTKADQVSAALEAKAAGAGIAPGRHSALLLALPPHEDNSRAIPMPDLQVSTRPAPGGVSGKVLVRADFSEDRQLRELTVLQDTVGGVSPALVDYLRQSLSMNYYSDEQHRAVAFAVLSVGDSLVIEDVETYLPKCCPCLGGSGGTMCQ